MIQWPIVTLANLRLIRDVAQHHSVSKAARLHEISQSAASQAIQELERDLGIELFDRSTRPLSVTEAGKLYVDYCRDVLKRHDELQEALSALKRRISGTVRLAAIYSVGLSDMSEIESRFSRSFPDAELQVSYLRPERVWQAVEEDEADLGLVSYAESTREIVAIPWRDEEMVVAVPPTHRLAGAVKVRASELDGETFVGFDDDLPIQEQIEKYLRDQKVNVETALRFDNIGMIKEAVAHGAGISIMPKRVMREDLSNGRLVALYLDPAELYRPVRIIHRRRKALSTVVEGLLAQLRKEKAYAA
jgi:LysR family transcriptional regulator, transcriptional activator of the cysJI operon